MKKTASQRGKANRNKGHSWEREVSRFIREKTGHKAERQLEYQHGGNIDIATDLPLDIQCKCGAKPGAAFVGLAEAEASRQPGHYAICEFKYLNKGDFVVISHDDFWEIYCALLKESGDLEIKAGIIADAIVATSEPDKHLWCTRRESMLDNEVCKSIRFKGKGKAHCDQCRGGEL